MPRYRCGGWLHVTVPDTRNSPVRVRMKHDFVHPHYTDIKLPEEVQALVVDMKSSTPSDVSAIIGFDFEHTILTTA
jgi:hypothetical protein